MKIIGYLLLCLTSIGMSEAVSSQNTEPVSFEIGTRMIIDSQILKEERNLLIHLPESYAESEKNYPVLYLLDGNRHFKHTVIATTILQEEDRIPEVIVIGLPNNRGTRGRDLRSEKENYSKFIEEEVIPYVNKSYRTTGLDTLFGHSLAGYFTINFLANKPETFANYIAASPVLQVNNSEIYKKYLSISNARKSRDHSLYFTLTGQEEEGKAATEALNRFVELLKKKSPEKLNWHYEFIVNHTHMTTPYLTLFQGLNYVFSSYQHPRFSSYLEYQNSGGMRALEERYKKRAEIYGTDEKIPEDTLSALANTLLDDNQIKSALQIYIELSKDHPESAMVFSGLGEVYKSMALYEKSIEAHRKVVKLASKLTPGWQSFLKSRLKQVKSIGQQK